MLTLDMIATYIDSDTHISKLLVNFVDFYILGNPQSR